MASAQEPRLERNARLVRERLNRELQEGADWVEDQISHLFPGVAGVVLNPLARLIYHWIGREEVIRRANQQYALVVEASRDLGHASAEDVVDARLDAFLRTEEAYVRARRRHPRRPELKRLLRALIVERVEVLGRVLNHGEGDTYEAVVASALPRKAAEEAIASHFQTVDDVVMLVRGAPRLLPIPGLVRDEALRLVDASIAWYRRRLEDDLDEIYGAPDGSTSVR